MTRSSVPGGLCVLGIRWTDGEPAVSFEAIRWALAQPVGKSSAKFLLVAMADCVNGEDGADMVCWPSARHLMDITGQDIKTVEAGIKRLRGSGYIKATGELRGRTGQVIVYRLTTPEIGAVSIKDNEPAPGKIEIKGQESIADNTPEIGGGGEDSNTPVFPDNTPVFPIKHPQISHETPPKTGDGTSKEPVKNQEGTRKKRAYDPLTFPLPEWLDREIWGMWCADRKGRHKPITEQAAELQVKSLDRYRGEGFDPREVIEHSICQGYQGLFPPKTSHPKKLNGAHPGRHGGFRERDYLEGITDGIPAA